MNRKSKGPKIQASGYAVDSGLRVTSPVTGRALALVGCAEDGGANGWLVELDAKAPATVECASAGHRAGGIHRLIDLRTALDLGLAGDREVSVFSLEVGALVAGLLRGGESESGRRARRV